jgi:hypothetical protein
MNKKIIRSILAVIAGFIAVIILSIGTDLLLVKTGIFPPQNEPDSYEWWMLLTALIYRSIYSIAGGLITALIAPGKPLVHSMILGVIGILSATAGIVLNWNKISNPTIWYPVLLILLTLPCVWLGGKLEIYLRHRKIIKMYG